MSQKLDRTLIPDINNKIDYVIQNIDEKGLELNGCTDNAHQFELVENLKKLHKELNMLRCKGIN